MEQAVNREHGTRNARRAAAGFTILELLIAATIALLIFAIGLSLLSGASQARSDAQTRLRTSDSARMVFEALERDLSGAYSADFAAPEGMRMTTTSEQRPQGNVVSEFVIVRYAFGQDPLPADYPATFARPGKIYRQVSANGIVPAVSTSNDTALCGDVERFDVCFARWDDAQKGFTDKGKDGVSSLTQADATHLLIRIVMLAGEDPSIPYTEEMEKLGKWDRSTGKRDRERRVYQKFIPIPDGVK